MKVNTSNKELGFKGELIARDFLIDNGYEILSQNWRYKALEVDLIAIDRSFLVILEVKTRTSSDFGAPEESVSSRKINFLAEAAAAFQEINDLDLETRFDIVAITIKNQAVEINHIIEAFHP